MIIRLTSTQITQFWDVIKYSLVQVERLGAIESDAELNLIFAALMSDKAQCLLKYTDDSRKEICAVMITEIIQNKITDERTLKMRSLYGFRPFGLSEWAEHFKVILNLASIEKCSNILFDSAHRKLIDIAKSVGFSEIHTTLKFSLGD